MIYETIKIEQDLIKYWSNAGEIYRPSNKEIHPQKVEKCPTKNLMALNVSY